MNDIIVLIPGIGGSRLEREGKPIYDLSLSALPWLIWNWARNDLGLEFTAGSGKPDDGIVATDLFSNQLIPGYFGIDDYTGLIQTLQAAVRDPAQQFYKFPYDWRASNRWAAKALDDFIRPRLHKWQRGHGGKDAKLWLVCHSMGGLVARYFLEHLGGSNITRRLITIGTPHRGAPKALDALVNGMRFGPLDFSAVIRSFASTYELLPQAPLIRVNTPAKDASLFRVADFFGLEDMLPLMPAASAKTTPSGHTDLPTLPNIDPERLKDALEFHKEIRAPIIKRIENDKPHPYEITCLFNRRQRTLQSAFWQDNALHMCAAAPVAPAAGQNPLYHQGDGTVPGPAAIPFEWPNTANAIALDQKHAAMPSANMLGALLHNLLDPLDVRAYMGDAPADDSLGLSAPPLVMAGEAFAIEVDAVQAANLTVSLECVNMRSRHEKHIEVADHSSACLEFRLNIPGSYRITARSATNPLRPAISDWVVVMDAP